MRRASLSRAVLPTWVRTLAWFAIALIAGEHSLASLHQTLTAHETCSEHGELVHADGVSPEEHPASGVPAVHGGGEAGDEHHHCGTVPASPARAPVAARGDLIVRAPSAECRQLVVPVERTLSSDVLSFAPKLSPPA